MTKSQSIPSLKESSWIKKKKVAFQPKPMISDTATMHEIVWLTLHKAP